MQLRFVFTGGGTGGHIYPAVAVANEIRRRQHQVLFLGTADKMEAQIVPRSGFPIKFVRTGALNRVGLATRLRSLVRIPMGLLDALRHLREFRPAAVFSTGGYVSVPVMLAALVLRIPLVILEPNATPGAANRLVAKRVARALVGFAETARWFPRDRTQVTGLPVRSEFFEVEAHRGELFTLMVTGASQGARSLNRASRESWPLFREAGVALRFILQSGPREHETLAAEFRQSGLSGEVVPFLQNMAQAYSEADLVVARAGAGTVNEIAAAGMPSILVPLPFAADDHQRKNAEAFVKSGAALLIADSDLTGRTLFDAVQTLRAEPGKLVAMRAKVRALAHRDAAERAADALEQAGLRKS